MTALHTRPIPIRPAAARPEHEHAWVTESRHRTSEGVVIYVRCAGCATRRIDLESAVMPPTALSHAVEHSVNTW
jgi:hypothetical protein